LWGHYSIIKYETENGLKIRGMWRRYVYYPNFIETNISM